jgi:diguanylate cyclase (GGDEF)-like protein
MEHLEATEKSVQQDLREWGRETAAHYRQKTSEVKQMLIVMARTAESVGERDQRCAGQLNDVTSRLESIATLDDLTQIRSSIEKSAAELKVSVERMTEEGKTAVQQLRTEVLTYQARLEEAEESASRDGLTGLRNRHWMEGQMERRIASKGPLSVAIIDINGFKQVNDAYGHLVGDQLLQMFAGELQSACRTADMVGRWGGDEFILILDGGMDGAEVQIERLRTWICGNYNVQHGSGSRQLEVQASVGLADWKPGETMKELLASADAAMYRHKPLARGARVGPGITVSENCPK